MQTSKDHSAFYERKSAYYADPIKSLCAVIFLSQSHLKWWKLKMPLVSSNLGKNKVKKFIFLDV